MLKSIYVLFALISIGFPFGALAESADARFSTFFEAINGTIDGRTYEAVRGSSRTRIWRCADCTAFSEITVGFYDYSHNYATTDIEQVFRSVTTGCGFEDCVTERVEIIGHPGLSQIGHEDWHDAAAMRRVLIAGDRMLLWEVIHDGDAAEVTRILNMLEAALLAHMADVFP